MNGGQDYPLTVQFAATDSINGFFLRFLLSWAFWGVACAFDGFVGHVWVNCTTILKNNAMMVEP